VQGLLSKTLTLTINPYFGQEVDSSQNIRHSKPNHILAFEKQGTVAVVKSKSKKGRNK
jgi:hypothetical protein